MDEKIRERARVYQWKRYWLDKEFKKKRIKHAKNYYYVHREEILKKAKEDKAFKLKKSRIAKNYYRKNKEKCLAVSKLWNEKHKEYVKKYMKNYYRIKV